MHMRRNHFHQWVPYLPPAVKLQQGNVFSPVCHSVHRGVCLWSWERVSATHLLGTPTRQKPPKADTSLGTHIPFCSHTPPSGHTPTLVHPLARHISLSTSPLGRHPPALCMLRNTAPAQCMLAYTHPLHSACWDMVNK